MKFRENLVGVALFCLDRQTARRNILNSHCWLHRLAKSDTGSHIIDTAMQLSPLHRSMLLWYCGNHGNITFREVESHTVKTHQNGDTQTGYNLHNLSANWVAE